MLNLKNILKLVNVIHMLKLNQKFYLMVYTVFFYFNIYMHVIFKLATHLLNEYCCWYFDIYNYTRLLGLVLIYTSLVVWVLKKVPCKTF